MIETTRFLVDTIWAPSALADRYGSSVSWVPNPTCASGVEDDHLATTRWTPRSTPRARSRRGSEMIDRRRPDPRRRFAIRRRIGSTRRTRSTIVEDSGVFIDYDGSH